MSKDRIDVSESDYKTFYGTRRDDTYGREYTTAAAESHAFYPALTSFIERYNLKDKRCLEIGSSGGAFQDVVSDYSGTDISEDLAQFYHKPYRVAEGSRYPFDDNSFDAIWSYAVFEHIPDLQAAMKELYRLLKPGGLVLFCPAWQCRPWAADGYAVRPFSDFGIGGKLIKLSVPVRDHVLFRSCFVFPKRLWRHLLFALGHRSESLRYSKLNANYEHFWVSDSDACNSIDPHDAILWFESNGFKCLSHPPHLAAFLVRTGALVIRKEDRP